VAESEENGWIAPGPWAVLAYTATSAAVWALYVVILGEALPHIDQRSEAAVRLGLLPLGIIPPFVWRLGFGTWLKIAGVVIIIAGFLILPPCFGLIYLPELCVLAALAGQRSLEVVKLSGYPMVGGALMAFVSVTATDYYSHDPRISVLLGIAVTAWWAGAGLGEWYSAWSRARKEASAPPETVVPSAVEPRPSGPSRLRAGWRRIEGWARQPPGWRSVAATMALAVLSAPVFPGMSTVISGSDTPEWTRVLIAGPPWAAAAFLPLLSRGAGAWLRAAGLGAIVLVAAVALERTKLWSGDASLIALILASPFTLAVGLRHGATPWRRVLAGTVGGVLGVLLAITSFDSLDRLLPKTFNYVFLAISLLMILWTPIALADQWFLRSASSAPPAPAPLSSTRLLVPASRVRDAAAVLGAAALALPWGAVAGRTAWQRSAASATRGPARPEMLILRGAADVPGQPRAPDLAVAATKVTQGELEIVMGVDPSTGERDPGLSVDEARAYCNKLSALEGYAPCYERFEDEPKDRCDGYRLPTVVERRRAAVDLSGGFDDMFFASESEGKVIVTAGSTRPAEGAGGPIFGFRIVRTVTGSK
jgi:hypothetical protein